ncbi:hypothetical protein ABPG72_016853 [Tetrahymena utriculariae]
MGDNIFLYIPNLIDYGRVACIIYVCFYFNTNPLMTAFMYALSQALDAFDGMAARKFNQCNAFGAVLDMVCDRVSDAIMLSILAQLYPSLSGVFLLACGLDIGSHWYQTYSTQYCGEAHHKTAKTEYRLLHIYYNAKGFLFTMVLGMEMFLVNMYLKAHEHNLDVPDWFKVVNTSLLLFSIPVFILKSFISVIQLMSASQKICRHETQLKLEASKKK